MTATDWIRHHLTRSPLIAVTVYLGLMTAFATATWGAIADVLERRAEVTAARDTLAQMEGRKPASVHVADNGAIAPPGSVFLEGPTVTVAGAALLQRIAVAVTKVGGSILSPQSKAGFIGVIASCELDQSALQQLLYDLEAGMPFLFIEQLAVQAPVAVSGTREGRLRLQVTVYGQWQGEK
jgi:general secretion pathway protein M